ncbi:MAG TPA: hypothetical protein VJ323_06750 [Bryobacteraceae bacterium]|jgi:hypothetical protein|nr:hypothetical protein [Bryobacteraceae bacterium]
MTFVEVADLAPIIVAGLRYHPPSGNLDFCWRYDGLTGIAGTGLIALPRALFLTLGLTAHSSANLKALISSRR